MFQPIAVYGPGWRTNSTSVTPTQGEAADALCPSADSGSPSPRNRRTIVVE